MSRTKRAKNPERKYKVLKVLRIIILVVVLILGICALTFYLKGFTRNKQRIKQLSELEGVTKVREIWQIPGKLLFAERYLLTFEQPLDWSDPSAGTFPQRVEVAIRSDARINVLETDGYCLQDQMNMPFFLEPVPETSDLFDGNYIHVEHRFFGGSRPKELSNTGVNYWEYLTAENAANDYHHIYSVLQPVLGDKWISIGTSRGGLMTNVYGYYYPDDMLVYVPYVAPCSDGFEDNRFYDFVYTEAGNTAYGEEKAQELRDVITQFQVLAIKYKDDFLPRYINLCNRRQNRMQKDTNIEALYDVNVLEFAVQYWQYGRNFEELKQVVQMPESTDRELKAKKQSVYRLLIKVQHPHDWSPNYFAWPYYVNTATTYGQYHYDFSYLRAALEEEGIEDKLYVTEEMEENLLQSIVFSIWQQNAFVYDGSFRESLVASMETTDAKHLMVFGGTDPWYSVAIPAEESENIRIYVHPTLPHNATISNMPADMKKEALDLLSEWIGEEYE